MALQKTNYLSLLTTTRNTVCGQSQTTPCRCRARMCIYSERISPLVQSPTQKHNFAEMSKQMRDTQFADHLQSIHLPIQQPNSYKTVRKICTPIRNRGQIFLELMPDLFRILHKQGRII